ncbi:class II holin family protein [Escherichia coli]|nr:class II holin family protein [Escherichia coli]
MSITKIATGAAYGVSVSNIVSGILNAFSYEEWNAIGVMVGITIGLMTYGTNLYFRIKDDRRKERQNNGSQS